MRNHDGRTPTGERRERLLHRVLGLVVQGRGRLIQDEDLRVLEKNTRDGYTLLLSARESRAPLPHLGLVAIGQRLDELRDVGLLGSALYLRQGRVRVAVGDVLGDGSVKEVDLLLHDANGLAQAPLRDRAHILPVDGDGAGIHVIEAREKRAGGGLATAGRPHQGNGLAGADVQVEATNDLGVLASAFAFPVLVRKVNVVVRDGAFGYLERRRAGGVLNLGLGVDHLLKAAESGDGLLEGLGEVENVLDRRGE